MNLHEFWSWSSDPWAIMVLVGRGGSGGWWLSELRSALGQGAGICLGLRSPEGLVPSCSSPTHQQPRQITLGSPHLLLCTVGQGLATDGASELSAMSAGAPGGHKRHPCPGSALVSYSLSLSAEGPQRTTGSGSPADLRPTLGITPVEVQLTMLSDLRR